MKIEGSGPSPGISGEAASHEPDASKAKLLEKVVKAIGGFIIASFFGDKTVSFFGGKGGSEKPPEPPPEKPPEPPKDPPPPPAPDSGGMI